MMEYIKAEDLKLKGTFTKKLIFLAPLVTMLIGTASGKWFQANTFNSWYMMIVPGYIALMAALSNQKEVKKLHYRAVFALPVSLRKTWISKNIVLGIYYTISCIVLVAGIILSSCYYKVTIPAPRAVAAAFIIAVVNLWQIPLCLYLARKLGFLWVILTNGIGGIFLSLVSEKIQWWICPYRWTARLMCPMLDILPNGLLVEAGNPLQNPSVIPIGILLSIILFIVLLSITAVWFEKQEVN